MKITAAPIEKIPTAVHTGFNGGTCVPPVILQEHSSRTQASLSMPTTKKYIVREYIIP